MPFPPHVVSLGHGDQSPVLVASVFSAPPSPDEALIQQVHTAQLRTSQTDTHISLPHPQVVEVKEVRKDGSLFCCFGRGHFPKIFESL